MSWVFQLGHVKLFLLKILEIRQNAAKFDSRAGVSDDHSY